MSGFTVGFSSRQACQHSLYAFSSLSRSVCAGRACTAVGVSHQQWWGTHHGIMQIRHSSRATNRMLKLGIGPDGKPLPQPNKKRVYPHMYPVLLVKQDGSTYTIRHRNPLRILTLPLDLSTLSHEEREERERAKQRAKEKKRVYVEEDMEEEDTWDQSQYKDLIQR